MPLGPRPSADLADIVDLFLATGLRIGEVLALRWTEVDLTADRPTLAVTGTLIQIKGHGIVRQDATKSAAGRRTVYLPRFAVEVLLRRQTQEPSNSNNAVFATRNGTWVSAHNVRRRWRAIRDGTGLEWVTPHAFRKTVATIIEREANAKGADAPLGHTSEAITESYYVVKTHLAPDFSDILEQLGPENDAVRRAPLEWNGARTAVRRVHLTPDPMTKPCQSPACRAPSDPPSRPVRATPERPHLVLRGT